MVTATLKRSDYASSVANGFASEGEEETEDEEDTLVREDIDPIHSDIYEQLMGHFTSRRRKLNEDLWDPNKFILSISYPGSIFPADDSGGMFSGADPPFVISVQPDIFIIPDGETLPADIHELWNIPNVPESLDTALLEPLVTTHVVGDAVTTVYDVLVSHGKTTIVTVFF